jgi:hypothetical protein
VREDDEDVFVRRISSCGIDERVGNICVVHVEVAMKDAPENALKGGQARAINYTSDKSNRLRLDR